MGTSGYLRSVFLLFVLACFWSSSFTTIKVGVVSFGPMTLVAIRLTVAAVLLTLLLKAQGRSLPAPGRVWGSYFLIGLTGNCLPFFLISWGEVVVDSGPAAILMAIMPLCTLLLAHFFTATDRMTLNKLVGLVIGFAGIIVLVGPGVLTKLADEVVRELAIAGAAVFYAVTTVLSRRLPPGGDPLERSVAVMICASAQMVPAALIFEDPFAAAPQLPSLIAALYLGIVPTAVASLIYFHLIETRGTTFFSMINYIIPCLGVVWGVIFLGERVEVQALVALAVILAGIAIANLPRRARASQP